MEEKELYKRLSWRRVLIPIIIGLGAAAWLLVVNLGEERFEPVNDQSGLYEWVDGNGNGEYDWNDPGDFAPDPNGNFIKVTNLDILSEVNWTYQSTLWMIVALFMMAIRDLAYMIRIRILTDHQLSWRQSFRVIMMWEFASALTPSVVGGAGVAMFILNREGIKMGKSTALVMVTALMDEFFYIFMVPLVIFTVGLDTLFVVDGPRTFLGMDLDLQAIFWIGYFFIVGLTLIITLSIFFAPKGFKRFLVLVAKLPLLRRWKDNFARTGDEIITTSVELKTKRFGYWFQAIGATFLSWTARYWVVNFLIMCFTSVSWSENMLIYARQLVMWVILLISPTPGSSGVAEIAFGEFFEGLVPAGLIIIIAILWRLISYYPYLFIGAFLLPVWLRNTRKENRPNLEENM